MNRIGKGIALALGTALISGVAIFVNSYAVKALPDAALFTTLKNGVAALVLERVGADLVAEPDAPALLPQVEHQPVLAKLLGQK